MFARQSLNAWKPRSSRSARYGIAPPRWQSTQRMFGNRSGTPLNTSDAAASVVSNRKPTSGISQYSCIMSTLTGCVGWMYSTAPSSFAAS